MEHYTCEMVILAILQKMLSNTLLENKTSNRVKVNTCMSQDSDARERSILNDVDSFLHQIQHGFFLVACWN